mgnify:CR=1 FL=1
MQAPSPVPLTGLQPELRDFAHPARSFVRLSPYRAGFEDCMYSHIYANPYLVGSDDWCRYDNGHADARAQRVLI